MAKMGKAVKAALKAMTWRAFSIEKERDGTYSLYNLGYIAGNFKTVEEAKKDADKRRGV
jgi:hypothetical protein